MARSYTDELRKVELRNWVRKEIGPIASPDLIQWAPGLPKTRSGKIMRRILRKIAENDFGSLGDTSTLADPSVPSWTLPGSATGHIPTGPVGKNPPAARLAVLPRFKPPAMPYGEAEFTWRTTMFKPLLPLALVSSVALSGCMQMTPQQQTDTGGALAGAAVGLITAKALGANTEWTVLTTLAGAAAGVIVARNQQTGECAYSNGDGTYRTGPCPT